MNDRTRAIEILQRARDLLASRLTDRILEEEEELLDDACGFSYMNEIDSLHEALGTKLMHLSQMLSALPPEQESPPANHAGESARTAAWEPIDVVPQALSLTHESHAENTAGEPAQPEQISQQPAIIMPAPRTTEAVAPMPQPLSLQTFAAQIMVHDLETAARSLEMLFGCRRELAIRCAHRFHEKYQQDPSMLVRVQRLRQAIAQPSQALPLLLVQECFELNATDARAILSQLRTRYEE